MSSSIMLSLKTMLSTFSGSSHPPSERTDLQRANKQHRVERSWNTAPPHYTANAIRTSSSRIAFPTSSQTYLHMSPFTLSTTFSRLLMSHSRSSTFHNSLVSHKRSIEQACQSHSPPRGLYEHTNLFDIAGISNSEPPLPALFPVACVGEA